MPAAAVIPAPIAYINVAAVKKLVVGFLAMRAQPRLFFGRVSVLGCSCHPSSEHVSVLRGAAHAI